MVAGEAGGIPLQMPGGAGGFLVGSVEECAEKLLFLLRNPEEGAELALSGKDVVKDRFLLTRLISDELELYASLLGSRAGAGEQEGGLRG
jgi:trehalose synthase